MFCLAPSVTWGPAPFGWAAQCDSWWVQDVFATCSCLVRPWSTSTSSSQQADPAPPLCPSFAAARPSTMHVWAFYSCWTLLCISCSKEHCINGKVEKKLDCCEWKRLKDIQTINRTVLWMCVLCYFMFHVNYVLKSRNSYRNQHFKATLLYMATHKRVGFPKAQSAVAGCSESGQLSYTYIFSS